MCCSLLRQNAACVMQNSVSEHKFQTCIAALGTCEMSAPLCKGYWLCHYQPCPGFLRFLSLRFLCCRLVSLTSVLKDSGGGAMRQRKLGSHTPPCHRRMVITTLFSVLLAALQRRPVLYHTRWLLTVHWHWSSGHLGQLAPTTHPQCRLVSNPCPAGRDPVMHLLSGS